MAIPPPQPPSQKVPSFWKEYGKKWGPSWVALVGYGTLIVGGLMEATRHEEGDSDSRMGAVKVGAGLVTGELALATLWKLKEGLQNWCRDGNSRLGSLFRQAFCKREGLGVRILCPLTGTCKRDQLTGCPYWSCGICSDFLDTDKAVYAQELREIFDRQLNVEPSPLTEGSSLLQAKRASVLMAEPLNMSDVPLRDFSEDEKKL